MWNKNEQRIRVAAFNFLTNISLDGTYRDTKIGRLGLNGDNVISASENNLNAQILTTHDTNYEQKTGTRPRNYSSRSEIIQEDDLRLFPSISSYDESQQINHLDFFNSNSLTTVTSGTHVNHYSPTKSLSSGNASPKLSIRRKKNIGKRRIMLVSKRKSPVVVFSNIPYNVKSSLSRDHLPKKQSSIIVENQNPFSPDVTVNDQVHDVSYAYLLVPSKSAVLHVCPQTAPPTSSTHSSPDSANNLEEIIYDANLLDNPELKSGKHRTLLTFPSYMTSIIDYAKPDDLKKELNGKFKEVFPHIQLSLSKLRSLKRDMRKIACIKCGLDLWDVAQAYVFFEKIILKGYLTKPLRKLIASACLILSSKLNDIRSNELAKLVEEIEDTFKVNKRDVFAYEFIAFVQLEFSLLTPDNEILPHYQRLQYNAL